ncbi:Pumilio domain-containing protein [Smittium culicis]|uniref:Pumilio domain-containing protein n=1 Tax=Smittium culicis TaxID=133412 RepID=A0A1R1Y8F7_9FUNG|nr:Pumilio domain-containing protein [Smittium culicis]
MNSDNSAIKRSPVAISPANVPFSETANHSANINDSSNHVSFDRNIQPHFDSTNTFNHNSAIYHNSNLSNANPSLFDPSNHIQSSPSAVKSTSPISELNSQADPNFTPGFSAIKSNFDHKMNSDFSNILDYSKLRLNQNNVSLNFSSDKFVQNDFPSQPPSPIKKSALFSKSQIHLSSNNFNYIRSVPVSRQASPEIDDLWKNFASHNLTSSKSDLPDNSNLPQNPYSDFDSLSKSKSIGFDPENALNSDFSNNVPFEYNRNRSLLNSRNNSAFLNFKDSVNYDSSISNNHNITEFDPHLPQGLLEDDEGIYINHKESPLSHDRTAIRQDIIGYNNDPSFYNSNAFNPVQNLEFDRDFQYNSGMTLSDMNKNSSSAVNLNRSFISAYPSQNLGLGLSSHLNYDSRNNPAYSYHLNQNLNTIDHNNISNHDINLNTNIQPGNSLINPSDSRFQAISNSNINGHLLPDHKSYISNTSNLAEPNVPTISQTPELSRNYSTPTLNNSQHSLLQQHYQELTKLLSDKNAKPTPKVLLTNSSISDSSFSPLNSHETKSSSAIDSSRKLKPKTKLKPKNGIETSAFSTRGSSNHPASGTSTPAKNNSDFSRTNSSSNLLSSGLNSNRNNRKHDADNNKYTNAKIEDLEGRLYNVCKDQYGCRYLQKQLEEGNEKQIKMIFIEITPHFSKLMVDPFGNYLCQKLFEHCNESQRTSILKMISKDMITISLNIHGTRAAQKLIDLLSTQIQIDYVIEALRNSVVSLIRDLNGNHVIQKCLNKLVSTDPKSGATNNNNVQFIYDSVSNNCIEVATHRHGCCVFQRCIDVASTAQLDQLVDKVTENALELVQDPFGNYVVQYIFDLNKQHISDKLISKFIDDFPNLSKQKFSSNVMEKSFKLANKEMQNLIVIKILGSGSPEQLIILSDLISDSFGNYVVQTILDFLIDTIVKQLLVNAIKLVQNNIKLTPYGKRIINKLYRDGFIVNTSGSNCPSGSNSRIPSPVNGNNKNSRVRMYTQNQIFRNIRNMPISSSISTPNLLSQNTNQNAMYAMHNEYNMVNHGNNLLNDGNININNNLGSQSNNYSNQPLYFNNLNPSNNFMLFTPTGNGFDSNGNSN